MSKVLITIVINSAQVEYFGDTCESLVNQPLELVMVLDVEHEYETYKTWTKKEYYICCWNYVSIVGIIAGTIEKQSWHSSAKQQ